jgi:hypothetical protein
MEQCLTTNFLWEINFLKSAPSPIFLYWIKMPCWPSQELTYRFWGFKSSPILKMFLCSKSTMCELPNFQISASQLITPKNIRLKNTFGARIKKRWFDFILSVQLNFLFFFKNRKKVKPYCELFLVQFVVKINLANNSTKKNELS